MTAAAPERVTVLGAGTMGSGIALAFAIAGSRVVTWTRRAASLARAAQHIDIALGDLESLGVLQEAPGRIRDRIQLTNDLSPSLRDTEVVVETIREDVRDKQGLLRQVADGISPSVVIATNTSSLALAEVFDGIPSQDRVAGLHWFNPPEQVSLVEIVRAAGTSDVTTRLLRTWMTALGKVPIVVTQEIAGFIANRLQYALIREAYHLVAQGICTPADLDLAVTSGLGPRWAAVGPFQSMDLAGLDVHLAVAEVLFPELAQDSLPPELLTDLVGTGALGCKSGAGLLGTYTDEGTAALLRSRAAVLTGVTRIKEQQPLREPR